MSGNADSSNVQFSQGAETEAAEMVHIGRQPVYDRAGEVVGYELLFRGALDEIEASRRNAYATSQVIISAFTEFGLPELVGDQVCFINLTREFIVGDLALPFEPGQVVLEILESVPIDDDVVAGVARLVDEGYSIALDDFVWGLGHERLVDLSSYVKLDVLDGDATRIAAAVAACAQHPNLTLVAERVETEAHVALAKRLGFKLMQGYALGHPQVISAATLAPSRLRRLELLGALTGDDPPLEQIISIVAGDPALAFRVLRAANSAMSGLARRVSSVREAVVVLGTRRMRQWVTLMLVSDVAEASEEQMSATMARARLCQTVAERIDVPGDPAFVVGLLSGVMEMLGVPATELVERLPLHLDVVEALTGRGGRLGEVLRIVQAYEAADEQALVRAEVTPGELARAYLGAVGWSMSTLHGVIGARGAARRLPPASAVPRHNTA